MSYTNKKLTDKHNRTKCIATPSRKRSVRISREPYDSTKDCLFCGNKVETSKVSFDYDHYSCVKTFTFVDQILTCCKTRSDAWSTSVQGRIEYFGRDLHAADCMYHHSCDVNFRTRREVPMQHSTEPSASKRTNVGRLKNVLYQQEAFLEMCAYFEDNDEEQLPLTDLANKMKEYLQDDDYVAYGNRYLKSKLLEHYGKAIFIAEGGGLSDIVTFREKTSELLRNYINTPNGDDDEETKKRAIIEAAAKLIKSDIKTMIPPSVEEYPKSAAVTLESALEYVPASLRCLLQHNIYACWKGHTQTRSTYWPHNCPRSASKGCNSTAANRSRDSNASSLPIKVLDRHSLCHGLLLLILRSAKV